MPKFTEKEYKPLLNSLVYMNLIKLRQIPFLTLELLRPGNVLSMGNLQDVPKNFLLLTPSQDASILWLKMEHPRLYRRVFIRNA